MLLGHPVSAREIFSKAALWLLLLCRPAAPRGERHGRTLHKLEELTLPLFFMFYLKAGLEPMLCSKQVTNVKLCIVGNHAWVEEGRKFISATATRSAKYLKYRRKMVREKERKRKRWLLFIGWVMWRGKWSEVEPTTESVWATCRAAGLSSWGTGGSYLSFGSAEIWPRTDFAEVVL